MNESRFANSQQEVANEFGVSRQTVAEWIKKRGMPRHGKRYDLVAIGVWLYRFVVWPAERNEDEDDPLLSGVDSPGLERYRNARADIAEMDAALKRREAVPMDHFVRRMTSLLQLAKNVGGQMQRSCDTASYGLLVKMIEEWERQIREEVEAADV